MLHVIAELSMAPVFFPTELGYRHHTASHPRLRVCVGAWEPCGCSALLRASAGVTIPSTFRDLRTFPTVASEF